MIVVRTKAGIVWNLTAFDEVTVRIPGGASATFQVADIAELAVDVVGGQLSLLDGTDHAGTEVRALHLADGETSVPVRVVFPMDLARHVGEKMAEGTIIVAKTLPPR